ncbi:uncharacterized protein BO97DRAFT_441468 [Aspergillus homomorphus CBS 101889]|uniref:DUF7025 domain-containing protein n=1 Tax=Aspergillus homomorphus (strain CBS 101889) TaxID=1450537 RepID=A0A395I469_ASPHC|nr:hypothetical protein BO97DRAFT_441468 [Aspergillus homomorphus CBS 101889]RAL15001.1 hypothetical protein BO97DRAFT_441468 [Aspergillus homomorphus CBS 101889]
MEDLTVSSPSHILHGDDEAPALLSPIDNATSPEPVPIGSLCDVYTLCEVPEKSGWGTKWTTKKPEDLLAATLEPTESDPYALIVRRAERGGSLKVEEITVQSKGHKIVLGWCYEGIPRTHADFEARRIRAPPPPLFAPFVHRWDEFCKARENARLDPAVKAYVDLLHGVLEEELHDLFSCREDLVRNGVITADLVWTLFKPGEILFAGIGATEIRARIVDFNGKDFHYQSICCSVAPYPGTKNITDLDVFPLAYHPEAEILAQLTDYSAQGLGEAQGIPLSRVPGS